METSKHPTQPEIRVFVLKDGTELVAESHIDPFTEKWTLTKPLKHLQIPIPVPNGQGIGIQIVSQLVPAFPIAGATEFKINRDDFLFSPDVAAPKLQSAWIQATTGLQVAGGAGAPKIIV